MNYDRIQEFQNVNHLVSSFVNHSSKIFCSCAASNQRTKHYLDLRCGILTCKIFPVSVPKLLPAYLPILIRVDDPKRRGTVPHINLNYLVEFFQLPLFNDPILVGVYDVKGQVRGREGHLAEFLSGRAELGADESLRGGRPALRRHGGQ